MSKIDDCNKIIQTLTDYEKSQVDKITDENIEFIKVFYYKDKNTEVYRKENDK
jgi:hypothetical protein